MAGGRIAGITIELNGDATKLTKALADVDRSARQSQNNLKDIDKLLRFSPGNTELLQQKFTNLTTSIDSTKQRLETLKEAARQMELSGNTNTAEWDALQREIAETEQKLKSLNGEMDKFGSVGAQKIAAAGEQVEAVGQKIEGAGKAIMPASVAMIGFGTVAAAKYAEVDKTMQLTNATMGNTSAEAEKLERAMTEAASKSTFGMNDAATAMLNFSRAGLKADDACDALAPAMNLAAAQGGNLDTVSAGLVATINGFSDSFGNAKNYADIFANACNNSALDVNSLASSMSTAAPVFAAAGYSVNDAALYMGVMANAGIEASEAANALKAGFARLLPDAKGGAEAMDRFGWSILDGNGKMKDTVTIQKELHDAFAGLTEDQQIAAAQAMFGTNQYSKWLALINTAPEKVSGLSEALNEQGTAASMAQEMMSGFGGSIEQLKSSLDVLITMLGKTLSEFLVPIIQKISEFLNWLNSLDAGTRKIIVTIGMVIAAAGPVLITIGKMAQGVGALMKLAPKIVTAFGKIKGLLATLGGALKSLWGVLAANPIILVIAAVAALVAGFIYLWNHSEAFRNFWINLWESIKNAVSVAWEAITSFLTTTWETISSTAQSVFSAIVVFLSTTWESIRTAAETAWNAIVNTVTTVWNTITSAVQTAVSAVSNAVSTAWNTIKNTVTSIMSAIQGAISSAWSAISSTVSSVVSSIGSAISNGFNAAKNTVSNVLNGIKNTMKSIWDGAVGIVKGAVDKLKSLVNFSWSLPKLKLPHFSISDSFSLNPPSIPKISVSWYKKAMQDGMILNSPTIFGAKGNRLLGGGEAGPEAVVGVSSLRAMIGEAVAAAGGMGGNITIPVYIGQRRIETIVVDAIQRNNYRSGGR